MNAFDGNQPHRPDYHVRLCRPMYLAILAAAFATSASAQSPARPADMAATPAPVATMKIDGFLKVPDIPGESTDDAHGGEIELLSWSWVVNPAPPTRSRARHAVPSQSKVLETATVPREGPGTLRVTLLGDRHSAQLREAAASGREFPSIILTLPPDTPGAQPMTVTMENVLITSYQVSTGDASARSARRMAATSGRARLQEEIAFAYKKITWN